MKYKTRFTYTAGETAKLLGIGRMTLYKWVYQDKLVPYRYSPGKWRYFLKSEVDKLVKERDAR